MDQMRVRREREIKLISKVSFLFLNYPRNLENEVALIEMKQGIREADLGRDLEPNFGDTVHNPPQTSKWRP